MKRPIGIVDDCEIGNVRQEQCPAGRHVVEQGLRESTHTDPLNHEDCDSELYVEELKKVSKLNTINCNRVRDVQERRTNTSQFHII